MNKLTIESCNNLSLEIKENIKRIFNETKLKDECVCGHKIIPEFPCAIMKQIAYKQIYDREYNRFKTEILNKIKENKIKKIE